MAGKRSRTSAEQPVQEPSVAVDPTDSTEQPVAGTTIQCRFDSIDNSSAAQPAKSSAEQPVQVFAFMSKYSAKVDVEKTKKDESKRLRRMRRKLH